MRYRQLLLMTGAAAAAIFIFSFLTLINNSTWRYEQWLQLVIPLTIACGLFYSGTAFPSFRNREKTMSYLMIPASTLEKLLYEFAERIIAFILIFPVLLNLFGNLAATMVTSIKNYQQITSNIEHLSIIKLFQNSPDGSSKVILLGAIAALLLVFTGSVTFKKYPLVKTTIFSTGVVLAIAGYFYLIIEKMHLVHPWIENMGDHLSQNQALSIFVIMLSIFSLVALCYSYFKLKEKEIS